MYMYIIIDHSKNKSITKGNIATTDILRIHA